MLPSVLAAITPPLSPSLSTSSNLEIEQDEFYTTASDLSKYPLEVSDDEDDFQDFSEIIQSDMDFPMDMGKADEDSICGDMYADRKQSEGFVRVLDPNCPIHGVGNR